MTEAALRALIVEDSTSDYKLVVAELRRMGRPIEFERVEEPTTMRTALEKKSWDFVLSDWSMPKFSAGAALTILKERGLDIPFVIVSGTIGEVHAVEAMRAGAHDYVLKDKLGRLCPVVERVLREANERRAHRQVEKALIESQMRFSRLAESGIVGITVADVFGNSFEVNEAYLQMIGYSKEEVLSGQAAWSKITPPEYQEMDTLAVKRLALDGVAHPWEKEFIHKDGSRVPVLIGVAMLDYPHCIAFITDLSEQKHAEKALQLSEEQLRQAQKMEAVGRLAGGVAHDFNNLLSVILSYSEMLLADLPANDPMRADIEEIKHAGERGAGLTKQLLSFSRQQIIESKILDLNDVLHTMDKLLRRLVREDTELAMIPAAKLWKCRSDGGQIEQVIMNLVVNAQAAMPEGGKLTIETANVEFDVAYVRAHLGVKVGRYVMLAVSDTGIGMDKETQARIFEPFFTTKETGKGTGLGLSTVFGIVKQFGGSIWVYSEPGKGTAFKIYLPRASGEAPVTNVPRVTVDTKRGSETILLVEDEEQIRNVTKGILIRHGYHVIEAKNAGEALLSCELHKGTIHLLLTDVVMPQMSGRQLAERLGLLRPQMKVLFMSGYTDGTLVDQLASGASFLQKPLTPSLLTRKIRDVLDP